ncbi:arginine N-succinyltransferase [Legionella oakridgensis]|uniref:Arginine and ornithine succinyltransferase subunits n=2 Tax=Legionella oakridgensis TaxID=29423 RepID=W0BFQ6_9GAMM|nr:arginine N-succinyltransferase [Legionella oakridgensis]AHE67249.1 arginine and ornithine succinyltransferase subunits [Legionella oakridgensis ATCC 33761 = DSM 21215]ETO93209.1 arginine and ornithine succinyltransferase subunit [Legionella oakridgensis RV-2-2007]KTD37956.1 arginine N-succinyltransferase, beta chain [Legionella oakridgensis]STY20323.1 arginine N-succinyltransferase [Legionella longbeachae]
MMLFRSAKDTDLPAIYHLAEHSGIGLTTLPNDMELLSKRLKWSTVSFAKTVNHPHNEYYLFVLEDPSTHQVVGTSALEALTGHDNPFYSYKLSKRTRICHSLNIRTDYEVLSLVNDNQGCSETCTLFLDPGYRHSNNGLLLSRARFLFMAHYPHRFASKVIAEMRGISDEEGNSPFWDAIGSHFFHMSFAEADRLTISTNKQFIADLMPRNPVYVKLIDTAAQAVIGKPHQSTVPAMNILMHEGFRYNNYVDIFDAGPTLEVPRKRIHTVAASRVMTVKNIIDDVSSKAFIIANTQLDFRATICQVIFNETQSSCIISKETAELLQVERNDCVRIVPLQIDQAGF